MWRASPQYCQIVRHAGSLITLFTDLVRILITRNLCYCLIEHSSCTRSTHRLTEIPTGSAGWQRMFITIGYLLSILSRIQQNRRFILKNNNIRSFFMYPANHTCCGIKRISLQILKMLRRHPALLLAWYQMRLNLWRLMTHIWVVPHR